MPIGQVHEYSPGSRKQLLFGSVQVIGIRERNRVGRRLRTNEFVCFGFRSATFWEIPAKSLAEPNGDPKVAPPQ